jgi:hypothetical protein
MLNRVVSQAFDCWVRVGSSFFTSRVSFTYEFLSPPTNG